MVSIMRSHILTIRSRSGVKKKGVDNGIGEEDSAPKKNISGGGGGVDNVGCDWIEETITEGNGVEDRAVVGNGGWGGGGRTIVGSCPG